MNELKKEFLNTYMDINRDGDIFFKSILNINIIRGSISRKTALIIIYETLNQIKTKRIDDIFVVDNKVIPNIINEFKLNRNKSDFATQDEYYNEINVVIGFLKYLSKRKNIDVDVIKLNNSFLKLTDNYSHKHVENKKIKRSSSGKTQDKLDEETISTKRLGNLIEKNENDFNDYSEDIWIMNKKFDAKKIKKSLNQFNKDELCFILNVNPSCCLEKEKSLKNDIVQVLREKLFDVDEIDGLSHDNLKECYSNFIKKEINEKKEQENLLNKVQEFNRLSFQEMFNLRNDFLKFYDGLNRYSSNQKNKELNKFMIYFDVINNESFKNLYDFFSTHYKLIEKYNNAFADYPFFNYDTRKKLLSKYVDIFHYCCEIDDYDNLIQNKIYEEFNSLKKFRSFYNDLDSYENISNTSEDNIIRIHNIKYIEEQFEESNALSVDEANLIHNLDEDEHFELNLDEFTKLLDYDVDVNEENFNIIFNLGSELIDKIISAINSKHNNFIPTENTSDDNRSLLLELESYTSNITFLFLTKSFNNEERSSIINKIREDIDDNIIEGDIQSIVSFYFDQYKILKEKILSMKYLEEYVKTDMAVNLAENYNFDDSIIEIVTEEVKQDIIKKDLSREDIPAKIKIYIEQYELKNDQYEELDRCKKDFDSYLKENNLIENELNKIFKEVEIFIENNYGSMKSIEYYLNRKINYQISINQAKARRKLSSFSVNQLMDSFGLSRQEFEEILDEVEKLIYENEIRSENINGKYLFDLMDENLSLSDEYGI